MSKATSLVQRWSLTFENRIQEAGGRCDIRIYEFISFRDIGSFFSNPFLSEFFS